jgi:hypothetical protein
MKYLSQIIVLSIFSTLLYFTQSYLVIYWLMAFAIASSYLHPTLTLLSRSYRDEYKSEMNFIQMIIVACFATFNILCVLEGSTLCFPYGVGVGLSFMATSYLITRRA